MKFLGADLLLLVLGLILMGSAGTALVQGGFLSANAGGAAAASPTGTYNVAYKTSKLDLGRQDVADLVTGGSLAVHVTASNITKVMVTVSCTDPAPSGAPAFNVRIEITPPAGLKADPVTKTCAAQIQVEVPITPVPPSGVAQGSTPAAAQKSLSSSPNATKAVGHWTVKASGSRQNDPVGLPVAHPGGSISLAATVWKAELSPLAK